MQNQFKCALCARACEFMSVPEQTKKNELQTMCCEPHTATHTHTLDRNRVYEKREKIEKKECFEYGQQRQSTIENLDGVKLFSPHSHSFVSKTVRYPSIAAQTWRCMRARANRVIIVHNSNKNLEWFINT